MFTIDASMKSMNATPHSSASISLPRAVASRDSFAVIAGTSCGVRCYDGCGAGNVTGHIRGVPFVNTTTAPIDWKSPVVDQTSTAEEFERQRPRLQAVAYRMLGSVSEAEDAVQEAWLRLSRTNGEGIDNLGGWLTTVVGRVCIDMLRARLARREEYVGTWLPEPIVNEDEELDPEHETMLADSVGIALLVVLETLQPAERLAFVLHDMFGVPFAEIAPIVERTPDATRQLASRARRRVRGAAPASDADLTTQRR